MAYKVTQADRDLVKSILDEPLDSETSDRIDRGLAFTCEVEEVAAHRIASTAKLEEAIGLARTALEQCAEAASGWDIDAANSKAQEALKRIEALSASQAQEG